MLVIRAEQFAALRKYAFRQAVLEFSERVTRGFPALTRELSLGDQLESFIRVGIVRAHSFGIHRKDNIGRFIEFLCTYGEDFAGTVPTKWARAILDQKGIDESAKMDLLDYHEIFQGKTDGPGGQKTAE